MTVKYPLSHFDMHEVHDLLTAYDGPCAQFELTSGHKVAGDDLADIMMQLASRQSWDAGELQIESARLFAHTAFLAGIILCSATADARIVCRDGYQLSGGQEISTPYCNDEYFAKVARQQGVKVTADEIRNNPARKDELCRFLDSDIRVQDYCPDSGSNGDQ